jgi:CBS domain-containing protein
VDKGGEQMKKRVESKAIREIMTASPITVYPDTSIRELKILFERYPVNALPVVDDRGVLRGIVSRHDFLRVFRPDPRRRLSALFALGAERVEEIMSRGMDAVEPGDSVVTAVDLTLAAGRRSLPVVERRPGGPVLVGMVSRTDLLPCLTLAADESPGGGGSHRPGPGSRPRPPRRLGRTRGWRSVLNALVARAGGVLETVVSWTRIPPFPEPHTTDPSA